MTDKPDTRPGASAQPADTQALPLDQKINLETARMPWRELEVFYARGQAVYVSPELDLVAVAQALAADNRPLFEGWMADGKVGEIPAEQAARWHHQQALVWAVVIAPWVLIQPLQ